MSGLAGILRLDGHAADQGLLEAMTGRLGHRGPDGLGHWMSGPVALGHLMLRTTPESLEDKQPLTNETGDVCLALDGRVDNARELRIALEREGVRLRSRGDAELLLRAYERWGERCPERILGDFAFVIWDARRRRLFCARDPFGLRPLYYCADGRTFRWSSELHALFADPAVSAEPNDAFIGGCLAGTVTSQEETVYRGIRRLRPAHALTVQPDRLRLERYWDLDPARTIRYAADQDYAEHFRELLTEAVRCRLRAIGPVGAALSGGLDSSSVAVTAHWLRAVDGAAGPPLETLSLVFPGLACDETRYIEEVSRARGLAGHRLPPDPPDAAWCTEQIHRYADLPEPPNGAMGNAMKRLARARGMRVVLTGLGGDEWLTGSCYHGADLLRQGRVASFLSRRRAESQLPDFTGSGSLLRAALWPLLPGPVRQGIKRALRRDSIPPWIRREFADRIGLRDRLHHGTDQRRFPSLAQWDIYRPLAGGWLAHAAEMEERTASWFGIEQRHPYYDRRIVELAFALPEELRWRGTQPKFVLREAMRGRLPETIRGRRSKADFSHVFVEALRAHGGARFFDGLAVEALGWVRGDAVRAMYRRAEERYDRGDGAYSADIWPLWMICAVESWYRSMYPPRAAGRQSGPTQGGRGSQ